MFNICHTSKEPIDVTKNGCGDMVIMSVDAIKLFFYKWPRNFSISFAVEALIAQPIARGLMFKLHQKKDSQLEIDKF
ncbi:MAG: hypothetical protein PWP16_659 [Eubacteriaceae bacterium]|jgi:hypothetical protein|nr:hypothetical protein [Eubacteriaceae bacterium]MDN5307296.1 hypothetical protein [Eubacteriaceae bacterium]